MGSGMGMGVEVGVGAARLGWEGGEGGGCRPGGRGAAGCIGSIKMCRQFKGAVGVAVEVGAERLGWGLRLWRGGAGAGREAKGGRDAPPPQVTEKNRKKVHAKMQV